MCIKRLILIFLISLPAAVHATPKIQHWTLSNGARVYFVETHALPMVQFRIVFDAASSRDLPGKRGLSVLTNGLLDDGTGELDADAIASLFEGLGAEYGNGSQRDMATVDLRSLSDPALLQPALDLFARILATPSFPESGLKRERERALVALQKHAQSPGTLVEKYFYRQLYHDHPYSEDPLGTEASLKAIQREDLVAYHRRYYVGRNAVLAIVGDVSRSEAKKISQQVLGRLPPGEVPPSLPAVDDLKRPQTKVIDFPATQTHIRLGQPGVTRKDPDYFPLYVGNYILGGGGLVSRLSEEVREKRGLSYSVYSYFLPMHDKGPFMIGLQTKNNQSQQALQVVRKVLDDFIAQGPTQKELVAAKKHLTGSFPLRLDSNRKIAEYLAMIGFYNLPLTYLEDFLPRIEAVTVAQIHEAFQRRVHPDHMATVIVGGRN